MKDFVTTSTENELSGELSTRIWNALRRNGVETFAKLAELFQNSGRVEIRNIGNEGKKEIIAVLAKHGLQVTANQCARSLYMCEHARCSQEPKDEDKKLYCSFGHRLDPTSKLDGRLPVKLLAEGRPLEFEVCQKCQDYKECGGPLLPGERGWLPKKA